MLKAKTSHWTYLILELVVGLGLGTLAGYLISRKNYFGTLGDVIFFSFLTVYIVGIIGISIIGYFHLKQQGLQNKIGRAILLSFGGLLVGIILFVGIDLLLFGTIPYFLTAYLLPIVTPLTGAVLGFNIILKKKRVDLGTTN